MMLLRRQSSFPFILASASARRRDLLAQIGVVADVIDPADLDEHPQKFEQPVPYAKRMAWEKAQCVAARHEGAFVLGGDTVVALGRRILPKADDEDTARSCLQALSGRRHRVIGGYALICPDGRIATRVVQTVVRFKRMDATEIDACLAVGDWMGKAGGYALQGSAAAFVPAINGSYSNVIGLSLPEVFNLLKGNDF